MVCIPKIGLEIHLELKTETKMFCGCRNDSAERRPNVNVCPICLAHPGTLPVPNKKAIELVIRTGLALSGRIAERSHFDRKSYFYPDLPKGYQISQSAAPLVVGGELMGVRIHHIHLEEDTGRLLHIGSPSTGSGRPASLVDFNRAGVPLMELVTEPDITSAEQVSAFARELQRIVRYVGASNADMEEGEMRVEVNVSVSGGNKVELKNLNSFRSAEDAARAEIARQCEMVGKKKKVVQETRGWDAAKGETVLQRAKESAHDYRYFPDPDIPSFVPAELFDFDVLRASLPELPEARRRRFEKEYGLREDEALLLTNDGETADFFEHAASELRTFVPQSDCRLLYNYLMSDLRGLMGRAGGHFADIRVTPESFAHLVAKIQSGVFSSRIAKDVLAAMLETGKDPEAIEREEGLQIMKEDELLPIAKDVVAENAQAVADYRAGKKSAIQFLVGQVMARTKGQAEPDAAREVLKRILS